MEKYLNPKDPGDIARALVQFHIDEAIKNPWSATVLLKRAALILRRFIHFLRQLREQTSRFGHILITKLGLSVVATALVLALSSTPARAASINVDGVSCTLIDAITAANTDTATGGCSAGSGADTLFLAMGSTHSLVSINNYLNGHANGLPQISSQITIEGNSAIIERAEGAPPFRLFAVSSGNLTLNDVKVTGGESTGAGGAMLNNGGSLTINNSIISGNEAYSYGGGVANENSGTVVINNSTINNNVASDGGGISQNTQLGTTIVNDSTVSGNSGLSRGGGLWNSGGNLTLRNSTISGNEALGIGKGGGLYNFDGAVEINNATFAYNYANIGGGVYSYYGTLIFNRSLLVANDDNTDYANNVMSDYSQTTADNYNVFGNGNDPSIQGVYPGPTDILPGGSREEIFDIELQDNGSDTQTHALVSGSPAIDAIRKSVV